MLDNLAILIEHISKTSRHHTFFAISGKGKVVIATRNSIAIALGSIECSDLTLGAFFQKIDEITFKSLFSASDFI